MVRLDYQVRYGVPVGLFPSRLVARGYLGTQYFGPLKRGVSSTHTEVQAVFANERSARCEHREESLKHGIQIQNGRDGLPNRQFETETPFASATI
jgi:hypothetical protein